MKKNPSSSPLRPRNKKQSAEGTDSKLPSSYGDTKIVALPRDPFWIYAYWEISETKKSLLEKKLSPHKFRNSRWVLRVYNIGAEGAISDGAPYFDIPVPEDSGAWHINCGIPNRRWSVSIGIITPDGKFISVARSNIVATPPYGISEADDETWGVLKEYYKKQILEFSKATSGNSSLNPARLMKERWEELMKLPSSKNLAKRRGKKF